MQKNHKIKKLPGQKLDYTSLIKKDLKILTDHQKEILFLRVRLGSNKLVANKLGMKEKTVASNLFIIRKKLNGELDTLTSKNHEWRKKYFENNPDKRERELERSKKYYQEHKAEQIDYRKIHNTEYYLKNRERILEKQKINAFIKKAVKIINKCDSMEEARNKIHETLEKKLQI